MSRIIDRQRQLGEQGRLRLGYTKPAKKRDGSDTIRPVASHTWVVTSDNRDHVDRAAELWGGEVEHWQPMGNGAKQWRVITTTNAIPAILPPGDPLSESYEMWSAGGCQRRCNGATEEFSGSPCICLAQHGEKWFELSARNVCQSKSRLKVLLPDMEGLGAWRMETGSYYGAITIGAMVDTLRGVVGEQILVPVWLRIKPETRVANNETKHFVVPSLELRGVSAGALLSGVAERHGTLILNDPSKTPRELEAASESAPDAFTPYFTKIAEAASVADLQAVWSEMVGLKLVGRESAESARREEFFEAYKARGAAVSADGAAADAGPKENPDGTFEAELVEGSGDDEADAAAVWAQIVAKGASVGLDKLPDLQDDFAAEMGGITADQASVEELRHYFGVLSAREQVPA